MDNQATVVTETIADNEIINRVLQGEKNLYAILVRRYNQRLYRVGISILNNEAEVEDAMQVAYIKAYENLGKFNFQSGFSTWLTRILINEGLLRLKNRKRLVLTNDDILSNEYYHQHYTEAQNPFMKMVNNELRNILENAIRQLPEKYRIVFIMREIENMNVTETKECLDVSEANVKVRLNRAKGLLKNSLSKYFKCEDILQFHLTRCNRIVERVMGKI